jgi:ribosomal protein L24E
MREPYDWNTGHCFDCGRLVRDGQGMQEELKDGEILRFCWVDYKARCLKSTPAAAKRAKFASRAQSERAATAVSAS